MSARLNRDVFTTSRLLEFCSQKELVLQTGHPVEQWPLVVLKELMDTHVATTPGKGIVDERLCFLERASARLILFEAGLMSLDEAVFGLFDDYCPCSRERRSQ
jgi:hypothetical protein